MVAPGDKVIVKGKICPFYFSDPTYQEFLSDLTNAGVSYSFDDTMSDSSNEALVITTSPEFLLSALEGNKALLLSPNQTLLTVARHLVHKALNNTQS